MVSSSGFHFVLYQNAGMINWKNNKSKFIPNPQPLLSTYLHVSIMNRNERKFVVLCVNTELPWIMLLLEACTLDESQHNNDIMYKMLSNTTCCSSMQCTIPSINIKEWDQTLNVSTKYCNIKNDELLDNVWKLNCKFKWNSTKWYFLGKYDEGYLSKHDFNTFSGCL